MIPNPKNELFDALYDGNINEIIRILKLGIDPNIKSDSGQAPIHVAVSHGNTLTVRILIIFKADINIEDNAGNTPLHTAILQQNQDMVEVLLSLGAKINVKNKINLFPIHIAASNGTKEMIRLLHDHHADLNVQDNNGCTALTRAISCDALDIMKSLIDLGADVNLQNPHGAFPIHLAVFFGNVDAVALLCDYGANINARNSIGRTPLSLASFYNLKDIVKFLLKYDACSNIEDEDGNLPLHLAANQMENPIIVEMLLNAEESNVGKKNHKGFTPLQLAVKRGNIDSVQVLAEYSCITDIRSAFVLAADMGNINIERLLLHYINPKLKNNTVISENDESSSFSPQSLVHRKYKTPIRKLHIDSKNTVTFKCTKSSNLSYSLVPGPYELLLFKCKKSVSRQLSTILSWSSIPTRSSVSCAVSSSEDENLPTFKTTFCEQFVASLTLDQYVGSSPCYQGTKRIRLK